MLLALRDTCSPLALFAFPSGPSNIARKLCSKLFLSHRIHSQTYRSFDDDQCKVVNYKTTEDDTMPIPLT